MSRLNVAILWHMHQPCYRVPDSRVFRLPWVRLHALKDYADMPGLLAGIPEVHATFNLVPALLDQLISYADGSATDTHLELSRLPADGLNGEQRCLVLRDFFMANWKTMIEPNPRYWELLKKRGFNFRDADLPAIARRFSASDLRDLQVWFNLSWTDPLHLESRPGLGELARKGRDFTEQDKEFLLAQQSEIIASVIPEYVRARDSGRIEISTTPYYHPILPLLCDTGCATESMPRAVLPARFAYPQDAKAQIESGLAFAESVLGVRPAGMWPSEGSVSEQAVGLMAGAGVRWLATDEGILHHSLGSQARPDERQRYRPHRLAGGGQPAIFFRDHQLSDLIGFSYASWESGLAAKDMVARLEAIAGRLGRDAGRHIVPVILDGENCWEFYHNDGRDFLVELYQNLAKSHKIQCTTFSEYLKAEHEEGCLTHLYAGSWINDDFSIWIGQPEDNTAWELLRQARVEIEKSEANIDSETRRAAFGELYAAEGSDWCWWYGGNFTSENLEDFDFLFRSHLIKIYRLLGIEPPDALLTPIVTAHAPEQLVQEPIDLISPVIDGRATSFYEWTGAGLYNVWREGGTMHRSQSLLKAIHYGFDLKNLYLRLDVNGMRAEAKRMGNLCVRVEFRKPAAKRIAIPVTTGEPGAGLAAVLDTVIEVRIPFSEIADDMNTATLDFYVVITDGDQELERHPEHRTISMTTPDKRFKARNWQA